MILSESEINLRALFAGALIGNGDFSDLFLPLIPLLKNKGMCGLIYFKFRDQLPPAEHELCRKEYMYGAAADMLQMAKFAELAKVFSAAGMKYCPLKGLALAQDIYPNGALRRRKDMDILLESQENCIKAIDFMQKNGWKSLFDNSNDRHCAEMVKDHVCCELHWLLPGKEDSEVVEKLWQNDFRAKKNGYEYSIPAELHFAMLISHEVKYHDFLNAAFRTLIDLGMVAKTVGFDREKSLEYCRQMGIMHAESIFEAFPEIFGGDGDVKKHAMLRERFLGDAMTPEQQAVAEERFMSWQWFVEHLRGFDLNWLRFKYNHGQKASFFKMTGFVIKDFFSKFYKLFTLGRNRQKLSVDWERTELTKKSLGVED